MNKATENLKELEEENSFDKQVDRAMTPKEKKTKKTKDTSKEVKA